jgi:hypothetical protein
MQVQIFVESVARHQDLATAMNAWMAAHPRVQIEEEKVHIFHNHSTNADDVLVMLFYTVKEMKAGKEPRTPRKG